MADDKGKLSQLYDALGVAAGAGTLAVGSGVAVNAINTLETLPPKIAPTVVEVQESPADIKRREAWQQIVAGGAGIVIGAGGLGVVLAGRRGDRSLPDTTPQKVWGATVEPETHRIPAPQQQEFARRIGTVDERREQGSQQQQQ